MSAFSLSWATLATWVLPLLVLVLRKARRAEPSRAPGPKWRAVTKPASQWVVKGYDHWGSEDKVNISGYVHVRIVGPGSDVLIAQVRLNDDDYEAQMKAAMSRAEDRVITLNAMDLGVAA